MRDGSDPRGSWLLRLWGVILVNLATIAWTTNQILGRWLRDDIGPITLSALRFSVATTLFWLLLRGRPPEERRLGKDRWWLLGMGLCGLVLFSPLSYLGLHYSTAFNSLLFQGFSPLIAALVAGWLIQEPVTRRQSAGAAIAFVGVLGLISSGSWTLLLHLQFNKGDLLFLASAVAWALYSVFGRRAMRRRSPVSAMAWSNLLGLPILVGAGLVELAFIPINLRLETIAAIVHICIVPTIIGYWCWNSALQTLGVGGSMVFYNTLPLYGAIFGAIFLGEEITPVHVLFGLLILAGGLLGTPGGRRSQRSEARGQRSEKYGKQ